MTYFENRDGSVTQVVSTVRTNYQGQNGQWLPIDSRLVERVDAGATSRPGGEIDNVRLEAAANDLVVSLAGPRLTEREAARRAGDESDKAVLGSWRELASVTLPSGQSFGYSLEGSAPVLPTVVGAVATYRDVLPKTDLVVKALNVGVKDTLVLRSADAGSSWVFPLRLDGLTARLEKDGSVSLLGDGDAVLARVPVGVVEDSNVDPRSGAPAQTAARFELLQTGDGVALRVSVDEGWLRAPERRFPVYVDPGTWFDTDGDVFVDNINGPPHDGDNLPVGTFDGGSTKARSFIRFDNDFAAQGVDGKRITSADLAVWHTWSFDCNHHLPVEVWQVSQQWSVSGLVNTAHPGPTLGAQVGTLQIDDNYPACLNGGADRSQGQWRYAALDAVALSGWTAGSVANEGLALTASESDSYGWKRFTSSNYDDDLSPALYLTWTDNLAPQVVAMYPTPGYTAGTLTPELAASGTDWDAFPNTGLKYRFYVYEPEADSQGTYPGVANTTVWSPTPRWVVPAGELTWGKSYLWRVEIFDGNDASYGPYQALSVGVPQPLVTGGLSQNLDGPGFSAAIGNYTTTATDAQVASVGPILAITRSYNSRDPRTTGAFGAGWSSLLDAQVAPADSADPPGLLTIRYPTGQEVTFGLDPVDGTWDAGTGRFSVLSEPGDGYELKDKNATTFTFGEDLVGGRFGLSAITDAAGRRMTLTYANGRVQTITSASGRALHVAWATPSGSAMPRVASISTDAADPEDPSIPNPTVSTWTYGYDGGLLVAVCPPATQAESPKKCHTYGYEQSASLHPTAVLDTSPRTYLRLGQSNAAGVVDNSAADSLHLSTATPVNVTTQPGPFPGSPAAVFNGSSSYVSVTGEDVALESYYQSVSLWFKTPSSGVLLASQDVVGPSPTAYHPDLYIGTDGKLHGQFHTGTCNAMVSQSTVTDNQWHHAVLTSTPSGQVLYVDGAAQATSNEARTQPGTHAPVVLVGAGRWTCRPAVSGDYSHFTGSMAEMAFFDKPLTDDTVGLLHATGSMTTDVLTHVRAPSGHLLAEITYDLGDGRVASMVDANGGTWAPIEPTRSGSDLTYASAVLAGAPSNYWRLQQSTGPAAVNAVNGIDAVLSGVQLGAAGPFAEIDTDNPPTAAEFDGVSSFAMATEPALDTTKSYSVSAWVRLDDLDGDQAVMVLPGEVNSNALALRYRDDVDTWWVEGAGLDQNEAVVWWGLGSPAATAAAATWTHLVVTIDVPAAGDKTITLYVDGEESASTTTAVAFNNPATGLFVGSGEDQWWLDGRIAEVATFRHELDEDEVAAQYRAYHASSGSPVKIVTVNTPMGGSRTTVHDMLAGGRTIRSIDTSGAATTYGYDTGGFLRTVTDANGNTAWTSHDVRGNVVARKSCQDQSANLCSTAYYEYFPAGSQNEKNLPPDARNDRVLSARDGRSSGPTDNSFVTSYGYDVAGNRVTVTDSLGRVTSSVFSDGSEDAVGGGLVPAGLPLAVTSPGGGVFRVEYYATGDAAATIDVSGKRTEYSYDGLGNLTKATEISDAFPAGLVTVYEYDKNGQLTSSTSPPIRNHVTGAIHTARTTLWYDEDGQPTRSVTEDLTGGDATRTTERGYNDLGQLRWVSDEEGRRTYFTYDGRGNRITQTPADASGTPLGHATQLLYDGEGRLLETFIADYYEPGDPAHPDRKLLLESRDYDPAGRLERAVDARGWEVLYTYTDNNQLATTTRYDAANDLSFLVEATTYDGAGNITGASSANGTLATTYDVDAAGRTVSATMDPASPANPNGLNRSTTYTYDRDDHVVSTVVRDGSGASQQTDAMFDRAGNVLSQTAYPDGPNAPVGRWTLDETSGSIAADSVGNSPAERPAKDLMRTEGHDGGGALFYQDNNGLATAAPVLDTTSAYTISVWVSLADWQPDWGTFVGQDGEFNSAVQLTYNPNQDAWMFVRCAPDDGDDCEDGALSGTAPTRNQWTHLVGVYDRAEQEVRLYVDGTLVDEQGGQAVLPAAGGPLRIGAGFWQGEVADRFAGALDDVQVYQRALNSTEIATMYGGGTAANPLARWTFDDDEETNVALDAVGVNDAFVAQLDASWVDGHSAGAAYFNRDSDGLVTSGPIVDSTRGYTVSAWVYMYPWQLGSYGAVVSQDGPVNSGMLLFYNPGQDAWSFARCRAEQGEHCEAAATAASPPATEQWTHLAGVYDPAAGEVRLYVNGELAAVQGGQGELPAFDGPLRISADIWAGEVTDRIAAAIDDVQAYQSVLTEAQVDAIYSATMPVAGAGVLRTSMTYDQRGLPVTVTDPNGATTHVQYDEAGRSGETVSPPVAWQEFGGASGYAPATSKTGYDTFGDITETADPKGRVVTTAFNAAGQATSTKLPDYPPPGGATIAGATTHQHFDGLGRVDWTSDALGRVTELHYDDLSRVDWVEAPDNLKTHYEYSLAGQRTKVTDSAGAQSQATFDYLGRQETVTQIVRKPAGGSDVHTTTFEYWTSGALKKVNTPGRAAAVYSYNAAGQLTSVLDAAGETTGYRYDFAGRPSETILPDNSRQQVVYDGVGRPVESTVVDADALTVLSTSSVRYDRAGNTISATDPNGATTQLTYDLVGQLVAMYEPVSAPTPTAGCDATGACIVTTYGYDSSGAPTRFTNGKGNEYWTTYNPWGLTESTIEPATAAHPNLADRQSVVSYDAAGQPVKQTLPGGVTITNNFDAMGRLESSSGTGAEVATASRSFAYDEVGRPVEVTAGAATNVLTWDDRGLLLSVTGPSGDSTYGYTDDGLLATRTDPVTGTTSYDYDPAGRLETIINSAAGVDMSLEYNELSQVDKISYGGASNRYRHLGYDSLHRLAHDVLRDGPPSAVDLARVDYGYDDNGNITSKDTYGFASQADNTYTYDWANRLTSWLSDDRNSNQNLTTYEFDAAGNRTSNGENEFSYDQRNRLISDGDGNTYTYTARGTRATQVSPTQTTIATRSDAFGQVIEQETVGSQAAYSYDGFGRMLQAGHTYTGLGNDLASDGTTDYIRDPGGGLVGATDGTTTDRLVWTDLHNDVVGQFTQTSTALTGSAGYDPLGVVLATTGLAGTLGYQSEYTDALTGRVNMHARWYNPETGQFDSRDTISQSPFPASINANGYGYGNGNPLSNTDPSGHIAAEGNEASEGHRVTLGNGTTANVTDNTFRRIQREERTAERARLKELLGPCGVDVNRQWGRGECTEPMLTKDGTGCPTFRPGRAAEKETMGGVNKIATGDNCTVLIIGNDGTVLINNVGMSSELFEATTPEDLAAEIDQEAAHYGGYNADGSNRALITVLSLDRAITSAIRVTQKAAAEREAARKEAECQKDFWCRNADWVGVVVGVVAAIGCGVISMGVLAAGCLIVAGALVGIATEYLKNNLESFNDVLVAGAIGAFSGLVDVITGGIGGKIAASLLKNAIKGVAAGLVKTAATAGAHALGGAVGGAIGGGAVAAFTTYMQTGHVDMNTVVAGAMVGAAFGGVAGVKFKSCHSFAAGTLVLMAGGATKAIQNIDIGDEVVSTDPDAEHTTTEVVTALHHNLDTDLADVTITAPAGGADESTDPIGEGNGGRSTRGPTETVTLNTTANHPFWDSHTGTWIDAADIQPGETTLASRNGAAVDVASVHNYTSAQWMYDLTVANIHTYYVLAGDTPVLVHNCGGDLPDGAVASRPAVGSGPSRAYQVTHAGDCEYLCTGGGQSVWADGIDATTLLDAKFVGNPARSPFIPGSAIPDRIRGMIHAQTESEFSRYAAVIADPGNPFTGLRVITKHQGAVPYFQGLMSRFGINGSVVVR